MNKQAKLSALIGGLRSLAEEAQELWKDLASHPEFQHLPHAAAHSWMFLCQELQARPDLPEPEEFTMLEAAQTLADALEKANTYIH